MSASCNSPGVANRSCGSAASERSTATNASERSLRTSRSRLQAPARCASAISRIERPLTGYSPVRRRKQQDGEAVEIASRASAASPARTLGREAQRRSRRSPAPHAGSRRIAAGAEVHQDDPAALRGPHDVLGFDVTMQQAGGVHRGQGAAEFDADERALALAEHTLQRQALLISLCNSSGAASHRAESPRRSRELAATRLEMVPDTFFLVQSVVTGIQSSTPTPITIRTA